MAFQFVPNADGSFTEGDKQTNPETNQEYIFTDGAWRPLGIEVATDLTELDARYLKLSGGTLTNRLFFDRGEQGHNLLISPNSSDTSTSIYAMNSGALRLRSLPGESTSDGSSTHLAIGKGADGTPETYIYHLQDPVDDEWAANKRYVDSAINNIPSAQTLPPGLRFKWTNTEGVEQDNGLFSYYESDGIKLRLNNISKDVEWNYNGPTGTVNYNESHLFTIRHIYEGKWKTIRQGTLNKAEWGNAYVEFSVSSQQTNGSFSSSKDYYITIAGIC